MTSVHMFKLIVFCRWIRSEERYSKWLSGNCVKSLEECFKGIRGSKEDVQVGSCVYIYKVLRSSAKCPCCGSVSCDPDGQFFNLLLALSVVQLKAVLHSVTINQSLVRWRVLMTLQRWVKSLKQFPVPVPDGGDCPIGRGSGRQLSVEFIDRCHYFLLWAAIFTGGHFEDFCCLGVIGAFVCRQEPKPHDNTAERSTVLIKNERDVFRQHKYNIIHWHC